MPFESIDWDLVRESVRPLAEGAVLATIPLSLISFALGLAIALTVALMRLSRIRAVAGVARA